jgi:hypothetical protein
MIMKGDAGDLKSSFVADGRAAAFASPIMAFQHAQRTFFIMDVVLDTTCFVVFSDLYDLSIIYKAEWHVSWGGSQSLGHCGPRNDRVGRTVLAISPQAWHLGSYLEFGLRMQRVGVRFRVFLRGHPGFNSNLPPLAQDLESACVTCST